MDATDLRDLLKDAASKVSDTHPNQFGGKEAHGEPMGRFVAAVYAALQAQQVALEALAAVVQSLQPPPPPAPSPAPEAEPEPEKTPETILESVAAQRPSEGQSDKL